MTLRGWSVSRSPGRRSRPWVHHSEKRAREQCEERMVWVERYYEEKVPADDAAADIGFNCG